MLSFALFYFIEYLSNLPLQHIFVEEPIYLLVEIHQIFLRHVVFRHFNIFENIEGCRRALYIWNIGCSKNDDMFKVNISLLIPQQIHLWCVRIFHDKVWNILSHHTLIPHGNFFWKYSMMWHGIFFKDSFLLVLIYSPIHSLMSLHILPQS